MPRQNLQLQKNIIFKIAILCLAIMLIFSSAIYSEVLTPEHIAKMQYVYEAQIAPNGQHIAYTKLVQRNPFSEDDGSAYIHLYVTDLKGNSIPYIIDDVRIKNIKWSPDSRYIYYASERDDNDDNNELYRIPLSGGESEMILDFKNSIKEYALSSDGSNRIVFLASDTTSTEFDDLKEMGFDAEIYEENWHHTRVWMIDLDDEIIAPTLLDIPGSASLISFSPDGKMLAMAIAPTSLIDDKYMARKVTTVNSFTGEIIYQFNNIGKLGKLKWSPASSHLAIISGNDINDPKEGEVYLLKATGSDLIPVITDFYGHVRQVEWLNNTTLVYLADQEVHTFLATIKTDGTSQKTLLKKSRPVFLEFSMANNGKDIALIGSQFNHPYELFYYKLKGKTPQRLTNSNPWMETIDFARQEVVNFKARDGLDLQGILIYPLDYVEGTRYPLILSVHGGPEAHRRDNWLTWYSSPGQIAAGRGYAVFVPNYRGSTGRGIEFSEMGQAGYAEKEFDDLVDAIDHLVNIGLVDRAKVGITGGSYGGYASAWAATALTEHFAASVMSMGVSDLISKFGTTDIPNEMYYIHAHSWPWEKWQWYLEQSPIYHAEKARTPLLILHGKDDTRVHPSQSMELYRYLKTLGNVPVRLVLHKGEGHGRKQAGNRYDFCLRLMRWFDHYLKGPGGDPPPYQLDYSKLKPEDK